MAGTNCKSFKNFHFWHENFPIYGALYYFQLGDTLCFQYCCCVTFDLCWLGLKTLSCWKTVVFLRKSSSTAARQCYRSLVSSSLSLPPASPHPSSLQHTWSNLHVRSFRSPFIICGRLLIPYISPLPHAHTCCFLDTMNSTAFSPVKSDINGNIEVHCRQCSHVGIGAVSLSNYSSPLHPSSLIPPHRNYWRSLVRVRRSMQHYNQWFTMN